MNNTPLPQPPCFTTCTVQYTSVSPVTSGLVQGTEQALVTGHVPTVMSGTISSYNACVGVFSSFKSLAVFFFFRKTLSFPHIEVCPRIQNFSRWRLLLLLLFFKEGVKLMWASSAVVPKWVAGGSWCFCVGWFVKPPSLGSGKLRDENLTFGDIYI